MYFSFKPLNSGFLKPRTTSRGIAIPIFLPLLIFLKQTHLELRLTSNSLCTQGCLWTQDLLSLLPKCWYFRCALPWLILFYFILGLQFVNPLLFCHIYNIIWAFGILCSYRQSPMKHKVHVRKHTQYFRNCSSLSDSGFSLTQHLYICQKLIENNCHYKQQSFIEHC